METLDFAVNNTDRDKKEQKTVNVLVRRLSAWEMEKIYDTYIIRHFPIEKLKSAAIIKHMLERGKYGGVGLFNRKQNDINNIYAYAFFAYNSEKEMVLLDYIAVAERFRGVRMGLLFMKLLYNMFLGSKGIIVENIIPGANSSKQLKDSVLYYDNFLLSSGALFTGIKANICGIKYNIWLLPVKERTDMNEVRVQLSGIYREMYAENGFEGEGGSYADYRRYLN